MNNAVIYANTAHVDLPLEYSSINLARIQFLQTVFWLLAQFFSKIR